MKMIVLVALVIACAAAWGQRPEGEPLIAWQFDQDGQLEGWAPNGHLEGATVEGGLLSCTAIDWDPFITSPVFEVPARPWQYIEVRMKSDLEGDAEFFWSNTLETEHGGFSGGKQTPFHVVGDGEWHTHRIFPFWHAEKKIIHLRFDLFDKGRFEIDWIRVMDAQPEGAPIDRLSWDFREAQDTAGWWALEQVEGLRAERGALRLRAVRGSATVLAPALEAEIGDRLWATVRARVSAGQQGALCWATDGSYGLHRTQFRLITDGKFHTYNIDLSGEKDWQGKLLTLGLRPSLAGEAEVEIEQVSLGEEPVGAADLAVSYFGFADAINRTGRGCEVVLSVLNHGGEIAEGVRAELSVPEGLRVVGEREQTLEQVEFMVPEQAKWEVIADEPFEGVAKARLVHAAAPDEEYEASVRITPGLGLPKAEYVPEPKPMETDYDLCMYYFPGWGSASRWECIERVAPIRKPVLGYYDEANPECADWQIKWAVEHGINCFLVDWYWSQGGRHLEHWLHSAYMNARHRKYLKWCIMWANHNAPDTHSLEDWRNVTQYWIDNYFHMEEYYRIDDRPAVFIWAPTNIRRDLGGFEQTKELYDLSQQMAKEAGYKGIYFVAMGGHHNAEGVEERRKEGYEACSTYHQWGDWQTEAENPSNFPFELVARTSKNAWRRHDEMLDGKLDWIFTIDTGWDSRPWHGDKARVIHGRTPELFEQLLRDGKAFADETGRKIIALGPANEWGEGSYVEPCAEFGFEMYDKIRDVFCKPGDRPPNIAPVDVGLGPYDFPVAEYSTVWTFDRDGNTEDWTAAMGLRDVRAEGGMLRARTTTRDPAFYGGGVRFRARQWPYLIVTMRISPAPGEEEKCQVFWTTPTGPTSEAASARAELAPDEGMHTYVLDLAANPRWRGQIRSLRFDPCSTAEREIEIEEIRLSREAK